MLAKCVLHNSGIVNKQAVKIMDYNGYEIFYLKEWGEDGLKFVMFDNHLFSIAFDIERVKMVLDNIKDFKQFLINDFEYSIQNLNRINMGLAQYLNRVDEAVEAKNKKKKQEEAIKQQIEKDRQEKERQEKLEQEKLLKQAEKDFINGEHIKIDLFLQLCDKYNLKLPAKTRSWCKKWLISISENQYLVRQKCSQSTVIFNYTKELKERIKHNFYIKEVLI